MKHKFILSIILLWIAIGNSFSTSYSSDKILWYSTPATLWDSQALHVGNGYMGASYYGGVGKECFNIAEKTFWTGGPNVTPQYNYGIIEGGKDKIEWIREAIAENRIQEADSLVSLYIKGNYDGFGDFSKVGDLNLDFDCQCASITEYSRGLDIGNSLGFVKYKKDNIQFSREYFCSYPDNVLVLHLDSDKEGALDFSLYQESLYEETSKKMQGENELVIQGLITASGLKYCVRIKVLNDGGELSYDDGKLTVSNANKATILYAVSTEYDAQKTNFKGVNPVVETEKNIRRASAKSYAALKETHISDYKSLFDRVNLHLVGDTALANLPTDQRIDQFKKGMTDDSSLKTLFFNFGRYLLISASRPGTLPSTLQGAWNGMKLAKWGGNYQSNINLQEMYWSAGSTQLSECQQPYIDWIEGLVEPGKKAAKAYYGTNGWVSHATGNIWKFVSPGTDLKWGVYPLGSAWHCRHLWEQYEFTADKQYLEERAFPIMKEAAIFYLENLMEYNGELVMSPSVSAEHGIEMSDGKPVKYTTINGDEDTSKLYLYPSFQDVVMIYDLFSNLLSAANIIGSDTIFLEKVKEARNKLTTLKIGKYGQLQEWIIDVDNPRDHHRHIPHLYALYPGEMITPFQTPILAAAAKKSLEMRGEGFFKDRWFNAGGNWSMAWRAACWTRLFDGNRAISVFNLMIRETGFENLISSQNNSMMVDGCMATPGIFSEMLLQSHNGIIHLLPALPTEWPEGEIKGLRARGGFIVNISWKYGKLVKAEISAPQGDLTPVLYIMQEKVEASDPRIAIL